MILSRFFKPKWQHPDPEVRKQAVANLPAADPALRQVARHDDDAGVRRAALERLGDPELLCEIARLDHDETVRVAAGERLRYLMSGRDPAAPPLENRMHLVPHLEPAHCHYLARHGAEPALRLAALGHVADQGLLAELAAADDSAEVRLAALARIHDEAALEQVVKQARGRDKRIYRQARERLEALADERQRRQRVAQLCAELENLAESGPPDLGRLTALEREWSALAPGDPALAVRYQTAKVRLLERVQRHSEALARRRALLQGLEDWLQRLAAGESSDATLEQARQALDQARGAWQQLSAAERTEMPRFEELAAALRDRIYVLQRDQERTLRLQGVLDEAEHLLAQASAVQPRQIEALQARWQGLPRPQDAARAATLQSRCDTLLERLRNRLRRQQEEKDRELSEIEELLAQLEQAVADGALQQAMTLRERTAQRLAHNIALSRTQMAALERRLRACEPALEELRGWRRWGNQQAREQLCQQAEALCAAADVEAPERARRVRELREAWKQLDRSSGPGPRALWERFDTACNRAYAPAQVYFQAQSEARRVNQEQAEALCAELEQWLALQDWNQPDWRTLERTRRAYLESWQALGPLEREARRALEKRFRQALQPLDRRLKQARQQDYVRRQRLVEELRALAAGDDLGAAIEFAKQAQAQWSPTVQMPRRQEQELWREFRSLCDEVFGRRQAQREAEEQARQANLEAKQALCAELEALCAGLGESAERDQAARRRAEAIAGEWEALGPVPRAAVKGVEHRYSAAHERFEQLWRNRERRAEYRRLVALADHARLCDRAEALLAAADNVDIEALRAEWQRLALPADAAGAALARRFAAALDALSGDAAARAAHLARLAANREMRQTLCLQLEILAGVESPPEFTQQRMREQVSRLTASLADRDKIYSEEQRWRQFDDIVRAWYSHGGPPDAEGAQLGARFQQAYDAFLRQAGLL